MEASQDLQRVLSAGDHPTWREQDWDWDPLAAQARPREGNNCTVLPCAAAPAAAAPQSRSGGGGGGGRKRKLPAPLAKPAACQADGCGRELGELTFYHQRNKICDLHIKADCFVREGVELRFCQRCGNAHPLAEFDPGRHSCRKQLERHNARRRKRQASGGPAGGRRRGRAQPPREGEPGGAAGGRASMHTCGQPAAAAAGAAAAAAAAGPSPRSTETSGTECSLAGMSASPLASAPGSVGGNPAAAGPAPPGPPPLPPAAATQAVPAAGWGGGGRASPPLPLLDFDLGGPEALPLGDLPAPCNDSLADELSLWLTQQLDGGDDRQQQHLQHLQHLQPKQQHHGDGASSSTAAALQQQQPQLDAPAGWGGGGWGGGGGAVASAPSFMLAAGLMQQQPAPSLPGGCDGLPLPAAPAQQQPRGPAGAPALLRTISVKLFGATPAELPPSLRQQLSTWFDSGLSAMEAYLKPGCVHLTVQATLDPSAAAAAGAGAAGSASEQASGQTGGGDAAAPPCCGGKERSAGQTTAGVEAVRRVVARMLASGDALWRSKTVLVQCGRAVALVHGGRLRGTWDAGGAPSRRALPAILDASPPVLLAGPACELEVRGINLLQDGCQLLLRNQGTYVHPLATACADCACCGGGCGAADLERRCCGCCVSRLQSVGMAAPDSTAAAPKAALPDAPPELPLLQQQQQPPCGAPPSKCCCASGAQHLAAELAPLQAAAPPEAPGLEQHQRRRHLLAAQAQVQSVRLRLGPNQLRPGLLHIDAQKAALLAPQGAHLLVVRSPAMHRELSSLPSPLPAALRDQLGVVLEWVGCPEKVEYGHVERTAARLLHWAAGAGLPATAAALLGVLQSEAGSAAAAAEAAMRRVLSPGGVDPLSLLQLSDCGVSAAALHRAARLGCLDGLSLLHRAVQSGSPRMLETVLGWGEAASSPWRCDLAGPQGLTPLHLAALLPTPTAAQQAVAELLRCAPGPEAWTTACTTDGLSPADFAGAAGPEHAALCAAAALAIQQQQQLGSKVAAAGEGRNLSLPPAPALHPLAQRAAESLQLQPSTPRHCQCRGDCPCARRDSGPCCSGALSSAGEGGACCGSKDGTCLCCADSGRTGRAAGGHAPAPAVHTCCSNGGHE